MPPFEQAQKPKARKRMNKLSVSTWSSAPGAGAADRGEADEIERTRRLTQPVVSALIENGLYRVAAAAKPRRHRGAARDLHADAGGDRQGRRLDGVVPRPVLGLRHDRGLSRSGRGATRFSTRRPASWPGARSPMRCRSFPAATRASARWDFASGSRQANWLGAHVRVVEADGTPRQEAQRLAGNPHHPVSDGRAPRCTTSGT